MSTSNGRSVEREVAKAKAGIADRIRLVRGERSQRRFARDVGVFQQNVNRYERGTVPAVEFVVQLALVEKVSPTWLLTGRGAQRVRL